MVTCPPVPVSLWDCGPDMCHSCGMRDIQSESGKQEENLAQKMKPHNSRAARMTMDLWPALWASGVGGVAGSERLGVRGHGAEGLVGHSCRAWAWLWRELAGSLTLHMLTHEERISYWTVFWQDSISMDLMSSTGVVWTFHFLHNKMQQFWCHSLTLSITQEKETHFINDMNYSEKVQTYLWKTGCRTSCVSAWTDYETMGFLSINASTDCC